MSVSSKHIFRQGATLKALGKASMGAFFQRFEKASAGGFSVPSPELKVTLAPRPRDLIEDYIRNVGGSASSYKKTLPPHFFPQWSFGLATDTLKGLPYPMLQVVNGGCRLEINGALPDDEPLEVTASLVKLDDNGRRVVLHQRVVTGTASAPEALVATMYPIVPLKREKSEKGSGKKKEKARVPEDAREIAFWKLGPGAGLDFAKLTGDFNPIHWIPAYAKMFGFKNTILHGFATMARAMEGLNQSLYMGTTPLAVFDVKFTRPLVLPAKVGLYIRGEGEVYVGDAPGGPAYLVGTFTKGPEQE